MRRLSSIAGTDPVARLMTQVERESWRNDDEPPTPAQVAYVLHALADHTSLIQAVSFDDRDGVATSIGRWLHAYGDTIEYSLLEAQVDQRVEEIRNRTDD